MRKENNEYLSSHDLKKRLRFVHRKFQIRYEFEDFYHDYVIHILEGHGQHQNLDQFAIDHIRQRLGRYGQKIALRNALKLNIEEMAKEIDKSVISAEYIRVIKDLSESHTGRSRIMILLHYVYGFEKVEIAHLFNLHPSRVCQIFRGIDPLASEKTPEQEISNLEKENLKLTTENLNLRKKIRKLS